jgi:hypothetical protein
LWQVQTHSRITMGQVQPLCDWDVLIPTVFANVKELDDRME